MNKKYIKGLNGYRALAIIAVTLFHIYPGIFKGGYLGVCMFFVLTGFLLANTSQKEFNLLQYFKKRIKRIYPALLVVIFLTCGLCFFLCPNVLSGMKEEVLSIVAGYNNWWQISTNADYFAKSFNNSPFTHFWFLGIELQYYLIWPLLFLLYKGFRKINGSKVYAIILFILSLVSAGWMIYLFDPNQDVTRLYYGSDTRVFALLLGSSLGFLYSNKKRIVSTSIQIMADVSILLSFVITFISFVLIDGQNPVLYQGGMLLLTLIFALQLYFISNPSFKIGYWMEKLPLQWIGKHSFSIYLWQYPVLFFFIQMKLTSIPFYQIIEILITLLLAFLLDRMLDTKKGYKNIFVLLLCAGVAITMGFGGYGLLTANNEKKEAMEELQQKLEEDAKNMEEKKKEMQEEQKKKEIVPEEGDYCSKEGVLLIGDSILLGCWENVYQELPGCIVDGQVSRYISAAPPLLQVYGAQGNIHSTVVIALGTNGPLYSEHTETVLQMLGEDIDIFFVNTYDPYVEWIELNNVYIDQMVAAHPNVHRIDWYSIASVHPEYLSADETHPTGDGCAAYARMIREAIETTPSIRFIKKVEAENGEE
ncbi:MAG: acyltransferase [Firmicutes bacterium]|nr:acyltransferase [Bacillota bacterium]